MIFCWKCCMLPRTNKNSQISNDELYAKTECYSMATEVNHRGYRWLGNVLRMEQKRIPKMGLRWNPPGKRKQGRPKMTLRKTFEGEFKKMELTWGTAEESKREKFMEEKEKLHYPKWIEAIKIVIYY